MVDYEDDNLYETYVPQVGEVYAEGTAYKKRLHNSRGWRRMAPNTTVMKSEPEKFIYRRPKLTKKEVPMSIPEGWRVLGDDEVIKEGDERHDVDRSPCHYTQCISTPGMTVRAAKDFYTFIDHIIREVEAPVDTDLRTERDAVRAADESGAIKAWYSGKPVQYRVLDTLNGEWHMYGHSPPDFTHTGIEWRPAPAEPPKPAKLDCRTGSEPPKIGDMVFGYSIAVGYWLSISWYAGAESQYTHWAPLPLPPEAK